MKQHAWRGGIGKGTRDLLKVVGLLLLPAFLIITLAAMAAYGWSQ